jgi:hypothetical protein
MKTQLLKIEEIVDKKGKEIEIYYFTKYSGFFKLAVDVIGNFKILLYGGTAINELLPEKLKIYGKTQLPDIDIFCTFKTYKLLYKKLLKVFFSKGYRITTIREALHEHTYKLTVEGLHVLDITIISTDLFNNLSKNKIKTSFKKIYSVNIEYLKFSLHTLIAQPLNSHKWASVFERMITFYKVFPNNDAKTCKIDIDDYFIEDFPENIFNNVTDYIKTTEFLSFGWDVICKYLKNIPVKNKTPVKYIITSIEPSIVSNDIASYLKHKDITIIDNENLSCSILCYKDIKFLYIFKSHMCASYVTLRGKKQLSIHSIIQQLYLIYFNTNNKSILCVAHNISNALLDNIMSKKTMYSQFIIECYGDQKGIVTLRKDKFIRLQKYRELIS